MTDQRMLFPEPAKNADGDQEWIGEKWGEHTFAIDPQESANRLPFCQTHFLGSTAGAWAVPPW